MADNTELNAGSGGDVLATDDISGVKYPRGKLTLGADGVNDGDVSASNPLPIYTPTDITVNLSATDNAVLDAIAASVAGTLTVGSHAVTNAGTFAVQAAQSGTWNITNVSGTISLPTGAATAAKQPALGTAGTASSDVITVQGIASMTPILATVTGTVDLGATDNAVLDAIAASTSSAASALGGTLSVSGTVDLGATDNAVLDAIAASVASIDSAVSGTLTVASHAVTNAGTFAVQVSSALPAGTNAIGKLAANSGVDIGDVDVTSVVPGTGASNLGKAEDAAHSSGDTGVMALAVRDDALAAHSGTDGDYEPLHTNASGALYTQDSPNTSGGLSIARNIDVDETEDAVKASAGQVYWIHAMNLSSGVRYLHLYDDTVANVVVGTTTPTLTIPLPTQGDTNGAGFTVNIDKGLAFSAAITVAATTAIDGTGSPGANEVVINIGYK